MTFVCRICCVSWKTFQYWCGLHLVGVPHHLDTGYFSVMAWLLWRWVMPSVRWYQAISTVSQKYSSVSWQAGKITNQGISQWKLGHRKDGQSLYNDKVCARTQEPESTFGWQRLDVVCNCSYHMRASLPKWFFHFHPLGLHSIQNAWYRHRLSVSSG